MKIVKILVLLLGLIILTGCSIPHRVSDDYRQYLLNNQGDSKFPQTDYVAEYILTPNTINHHYEFHCATTGYAHLWIVEFGKMLEETLTSNDFQSAFKKLSKSSDDSATNALRIKYNLVEYEFKGFEARVRLQVTIIEKGSIVLDKTYFETGKSQGGKMFWGGAFGMKNAIQQSTKSAIDKILSQSLIDMKSNI